MMGSQLRSSSRTVVAELHVTHRRGVTRIRTAASAVVVHIPDLDLAVVASGEKQVAVVGEKTNDLHPLGVPLPCVKVFFRDVARVVTFLIRLHAARGVAPRTAYMKEGGERWRKREGGKERARLGDGVDFV